MTTTEIIKKRRAIFPAMYSGEEVNDDIITEVLELVAYAPTHRLTQPWKFKVFSGEGLKRLSEYLGNFYNSNTPTDKYSETKHKKTINKPLMSTHVIAIIMKRDEEERVPEWEEIASVAMGVQNMWLGFTERGIGCYWSSPKSMIEARQFLMLNPGERCLGVMYVGRPAVHPPMPRREDMKFRTECIIS